MSEWQVVPLAAEQVRGMSECHIACWRESYAGLVPQHVLDAFDLDRRAQAWERIRVEYPGRIVVAVHDDGTVIGFASSGPPRDESPVAERELSALYVRAAYYGTGVAQELMARVLSPDADTALWVFEENPRAQAFYRKYGFELDGERRAEAFTPAIQVRMVRRAPTR
ncbi:GNAT family N-acetyltransferase [Nocardia yunnanensis]|uniref:GNAT family N-acetyltransferase n=1 Tax=Nocardia yunnanensis TaxID=2382165 RepID=A0A386ZCV3_9NOCA|nr:GNAT family N-acetyltransferase [Nocardia yunnanensis]AYF75167.1 GNAT family N-acetyltransferase [Nocardia yunnanensis]